VTVPASLLAATVSLIGGECAIGEARPTTFSDTHRISRYAPPAPVFEAFAKGKLIGQGIGPKTGAVTLDKSNGISAYLTAAVMIQMGYATLFLRHVRHSVVPIRELMAPARLHERRRGVGERLAGE
jgi:hypothetical protein